MRAFVDVDADAWWGNVRRIVAFKTRFSIFPADLFSSSISYSYYR